MIHEVISLRAQILLELPHRSMSVSASASASVSLRDSSGVEGEAQHRSEGRDKVISARTFSSSLITGEMRTRLSKELTTGPKRTARGVRVRVRVRAGTQ